MRPRGAARRAVAPAEAVAAALRPRAMTQSCGASRTRSLRAPRLRCCCGTGAGGQRRPASSRRVRTRSSTGRRGAVPSEARAARSSSIALTSASSSSERRSRCKVTNADRAPLSAAAAAWPCHFLPPPAAWAAAACNVDATLSAAACSVDGSVLGLSYLCLWGPASCVCGCHRCQSWLLAWVSPSWLPAWCACLGCRHGRAVRGRAYFLLWLAVGVGAAAGGLLAASRHSTSRQWHNRLGSLALSSFLTLWVVCEATMYAQVSACSHA